MQSICTCFTLPKKRSFRNTDVTHTTAESVVHFVDPAWEKVGKYSLSHHKCATSDATLQGCPNLLLEEPKVVL